MPNFLVRTIQPLADPLPDARNQYMSKQVL